MFYEFRVSCIATETKLKNYADSLKNIASISNQVSKSFDRSIQRETAGAVFFLFNAGCDIRGDPLT